MSRTKPAPRIVVDTNVALSALVFGGGRFDTLRLAWQSVKMRATGLQLHRERISSSVGVPKIQTFRSSAARVACRLSAVLHDGEAASQVAEND